MFDTKVDDALARKDARIADLEMQLASVTLERDAVRDAARVWAAQDGLADDGSGPVAYMHHLRARAAESERGLDTAVSAIKSRDVTLRAAMSQVAALRAALRAVLPFADSRLEDINEEANDAGAGDDAGVQGANEAIATAHTLLADTASVAERYVDVDGEEMRVLLFDAWGNGRGNGKDRDGAKLIAEFKARRGGK